MIPRRGLAPEAYRRITALALAALSVIIVTGAAVRLTGSGLGCTDWPNCRQGRLVATMSFHPMVEFVNRLFTGAVSIAVILAVLGSLRRVPRRRDLTWWSLGLVAGVIGQIILGGMVVLFDLSPWLVIGHFVLSMVLVWNAVVLHHRAGHEQPEPAAFRGTLALSARAWFVLAMVVIATGTIVTGSGPHGGNEDVKRLPFLFSSAARVHGSTVMAFLAVTLFLLVRTRRMASASVRNGMRNVLIVLVIQGAIGYTQYFTKVPPLLVGFHIAGATALWITVVQFALSAGMGARSRATANRRPAMTTVPA